MILNNNINYRWPELNIEKINDTCTDFEKATVNKNIGTKKRKLFHEDKDVTMDIVQSIHNLSVQNTQENGINTK